MTVLLPLRVGILRNSLELLLLKGGESEMKTLFVVIFTGTALFLGACASTHPKMSVHQSKDIVLFEGSF